MRLWLLLPCCAVLAASSAWLGLKARRATQVARQFLEGRPGAVLKPAQFAAAGWRDVSFASADGVLLRGWYRESTNGAAILFAPGWGQSRLAMWEQAQTFTSKGYGALLFDLRAHGESGGTLSTLGDRERADVRAAVAFVTAQKDVHAGRLGAFGFSVGASAIAVIAAEDPRIAAVALESPYSTLEESERSDFRGFGVIGEWMALRTLTQAGVDLNSVRPIEALTLIAPRPMFILFGAREQSDEMVGRILRAAPASAQQWLVPNAGHGGCREAAGSEYDRRLFEFFDAALTPRRG